MGKSTGVTAGLPAVAELAAKERAQQQRRAPEAKPAAASGTVRMKAPPTDNPNDEWWCNSTRLVPDAQGIADVPAELVQLAQQIGFRPLTPGTGPGLVEFAIRETTARQAAKGLREGAADEARRAREGAAMIDKPPKL